MIKDVIQDLGLEKYITPDLAEFLAHADNNLFAWQIVNLCCFILERDELVGQGAFNEVTKRLRSYESDQSDAQENHMTPEQQHRLTLIHGYAEIAPEHIQAITRELFSPGGEVNSLDEVIQILKTDGFFGLHPLLELQLMRFITAEKERPVEVAELDLDITTAMDIDQPDETEYDSNSTELFCSGKLPGAKSKEYAGLLPKLLVWADQQLLELKDRIGQLDASIVRNLDVHNLTEIKAKILKQVLLSYSSYENNFIQLFLGKNKVKGELKWSINQVKIMLIILQYHELTWGGGGIRPNDLASFKNDLFEVLKQSQPA